MSPDAHRTIYADTETTGLDATKDRVIEIGLIEYVDRKATGQVFHVFLNPQQEIDPTATAIHGMTWDHLRDQPLFSDVARDFVEFIKGAELIIHNAPFDVAMLESEFKRIGQNVRLAELCTITDSVQIARRKNPGARSNLDSLCERYGVNNSKRDLHGALLDAQLLADVHLSMTSGQDSLQFGESKEADGKSRFSDLLGVDMSAPGLVIPATEAEMAAHLEKMKAIAKKVPTPVWDGPSMG